METMEGLKKAIILIIMLLFGVYMGVEIGVEMTKSHANGTVQSTDTTTSAGTNEKKSNKMFTEIEEDNSGLLDMDKKYQYYYYLTDTGIIYAGSGLVMGTTQSTNGVPVISTDGHFMRYNTETNSAEIVE
jgi:hypothetical protein